jgi:hypothetical protein
MKSQDLKEKLFDLIHGRLSKEEEEEIIARLKELGMSMEEIESMRSVSKLIDNEPIPEPSVRMDKRFYTMLEEEQKKALLGEQDFKPKRAFLLSLKTSGLRIAAGIALFLLGWFSASWFGSNMAGGKQITVLSGEVKQLKETLVLSMMQQNSPQERIKAVNMVSAFDNADSQIIESLVGVLNHDSNDNVRLLALDALIRYSWIPEVRTSLIESIRIQNSPMIQFRLAQIMVRLNEKRAVPEFQKVLQDASLNYSVRGKMNEAIAQLL